MSYDLSSGACCSQREQSCGLGMLLQSTLSHRPLKLNSCAIMSNLALAGDVPTDQNSAYRKMTGRSLMKENLGLSKHALILWLESIEKEGYWHKLWENLLYTRPMKLPQGFQLSQIPTADPSIARKLPFPVSVCELNQEAQMKSWVSWVQVSIVERRGQQADCWPVTTTHCWFPRRLRAWATQVQTGKTVSHSRKESHKNQCDFFF